MKRLKLYTTALSLAVALTISSCKHDYSMNPNYIDNSPFFLCSVRGNQAKPDDNSQRFGFFSSRLWEDYEENLRSEIDVFGVVPGYVLWYIQMGDDFPLQVAECNKAQGIRTVINHDLRSDAFSQERNEQQLKEIVAGQWDDYFTRFAHQARDFNFDVYYRFGYEMNGKWFPWGEKEKLYVNAWRHVWKIFKHEKVNNVSWVFSPSVVWGQKTFEKDILPYYPGDQYVDIVALDGYNFGDSHDKYHQWESFYRVYSGSIIGLLSFNKPMWIAEIGCPSEPRRYHWLQEFLEFFDTNNCFEVFFWFNEYKRGEPNFRIDADDASLQVFREWAQRGKHSETESDQLATLQPAFLDWNAHE